MSFWQRPNFILRTLIGLPITVAIAVTLLHLLPIEVINIFTVWLLVSLPVGVLIGHCVLDRK